MIREMLLEEHSRQQCIRITEHIGNNKTKFRELIKLFCSDENMLVQRAAWPVSNCIEKHPELIEPYWNELMSRLETPALHPAVYRNITRLLQFVSIPEIYHGRIMTICFEYISDPESAIATKVSSLTVLHQLSKVYPDIIPELKLIIEERMNTETAAFRSRGKKILKFL